MDYKHKSGAQKRKIKTRKEHESKKGQKMLSSFDFIKKGAVESDIQSSSTNKISLETSASISAEIRTESNERLDTTKISADNRTESDNRTEPEIMDTTKVTNVNVTGAEDDDVKSARNSENVKVPKPYDFDIGLCDSTGAMPATVVQEAVRRGPQAHPKIFPDDDSGHRFPISVLRISLANGEKIERDWLTWSRHKQALFCFPCRLFSTFSDNKRSTLTIPTGFSVKDKWKKLHDRVPQHENSQNHKDCYVKWRALEVNLDSKYSVDSLLLDNIQREKNRWRQILTRFLDVTIFLGERGLPFRGSSTLVGDPTNGNFLGIMELISHYDPVLADHMSKVKQSQSVHKRRLQVHYLSPEIQNEFIECCAAHIVRAILKERELAKYYSIIVDATPDSAHMEQTVFILRYILLDENSHKYIIHERFLEFVDCNRKTGQAIAELIFSTLKKHDIPLADCRGQGYDNGSNMRGQYKGVQSLILSDNKLATFSPCACHTLNLCGVEAAECCPEAITFFGVVQKLYKTFSCSPQRWEILQKNIGCSLHSRSETRWSARVDSVRPFAAHIPGIRKAIEDLQMLNLTAETRTDIGGIETYLDTLECVLMASIWTKILTAINYRNVVLQARQATLDIEVKNLEDLIADLKHIRNSWESIFKECKIVAVNIGIQETFSEKRRRVKRRFFGEQDQTVTETSPEEQFKQTVFYVLVDCLLGNITSRFLVLKELESRFGIFWKYQTMNQEDVRNKAESFCKYYDVDVSTGLIEEIVHLQAIHNANLGTETLPPLELLNKLHELKMEILFPNICIALRIFCTIPVSVAEGERAFSVLSRVKNVLRSTMCQDRLTHLGTLASEPFLARQLDFESVISYFADQKSRKAFLK